MSRQKEVRIKKRDCELQLFTEVRHYIGNLCIKVKISLCQISDGK